MSKNALPPSLVGCCHKDKRHINSALGATIMSVLPAKADLLPLGPIARACGPRGCSLRAAPASQDRRQRLFSSGATENGSPAHAVSCVIADQRANSEGEAKMI